MTAIHGGASGARLDLGHNSDINVTPFIDILLVLLIVIMVAVPVATMALKIDAPPIDSRIKAPPPTFVSIGRDGQVSVQGPRGATPTDLGHLAATLSQSLNSPNPQSHTILVRADRGARYADFMAAVNQLQSDGFLQVALIAEEPGP